MTYQIHACPVCNHLSVVCRDGEFSCKQGFCPSGDIFGTSFEDFCDKVDEAELVEYPRNTPWGIKQAMRQNVLGRIGYN